MLACLLGAFRHAAMDLHGFYIARHRSAKQIPLIYHMYSTVELQLSGPGFLNYRNDWFIGVVTVLLLLKTRIWFLTNVLYFTCSFMDYSDLYEYTYMDHPLVQVTVWDSTVCTMQMDSRYQFFSRTAQGVDSQKHMRASLWLATCHISNSSNIFCHDWIDCSKDTSLTACSSFVALSVQWLEDM